MKWCDGELINPFTGKLLARDSPHSLSSGGVTRFPVVEEIPFIRLGREKLSAEVLRALDLNDQRAALVLLFQDQDDWAKTPPPTENDLAPLFENHALTLREAMKNLNYGAVADYFAYRWSDPTFLSGLALLKNHLPPETKTVLELCCGIGHYLREFILRGIEAVGVDAVFSKLWLARKFVAPAAKIVCADANFAFPFADQAFDATFCHDAFYFLPKKEHVAGELKRVTTENVLIGHAHNSKTENFSGGAAVSVEEYRLLFDDPILYDDDELSRSLIEDRRPQANFAEELRKSPAIALVRENRESSVKKDYPSFELPLANRRLRLNPLLIGAHEQILPTPRYPSERYKNEYAELSEYLCLNEEEMILAEQTKKFDGTWTANVKLKNLVRRRIFLDLPENW